MTLQEFIQIAKDMIENEKVSETSSYTIKEGKITSVSFNIKID